MSNNENSVEMGETADTNQTNVVAIKGKKLEIKTRPNASDGYWLCFLLPFCFLVNIYKNPKIFSTFDYQLTTITAIGFNLQSISFFLYLNFKSNSLMSLLYTITPSTIVSILIYYFVKQNAFFVISFGFMALYQFLHIKILQCFPKSFTLGESSVVLQGILLFTMNAVMKIPKFLKQNSKTPLEEMQAIMMTALFALIILGMTFYAVELFRNPVFFYLLMISYVIFVCAVPVTRDYPIITLWKFITNDLNRIFIIAFYFSLVGLTTAAVIWRLNKSEKATTSIRKIFHGIVVLVFIPGLIYECILLYIASGVALAILIILEILRVLKIPPFYEYLEKMTKSFVDEKDSGLFAFTPIYLLVGCSLPLWISPNPCSVKENLIPLLSGVITIGIGDTAASVIGSRYGQIKWPGTTKSFEGTLANAMSQSAIILLFFALGYVQLKGFGLFVIPITITITSFIEAFTDQIDNLVLPLVSYILSSLA